MTTVTITASVGPGLEATALVFENVKSIKYEYTFGELKSGVIEIVYMEDNDRKIQYFDMDGITTVTHVIAGVDTTITIS